jgi:hypothetical protein
MRTKTMAPLFHVNYAMLDRIPLLSGRVCHFAALYSCPHGCAQVLRENAAASRTLCKMRELACLRCDQVPANGRAHADVHRKH